MNIVVLIADTWRADYLGCYGNDWIQTPHLDQLAQEGVCFTNCYADGLPTIPARRVFFTGRSILPLDRSPQLKGITPRIPGWRQIEDDIPTFAEVLQGHGYTTALIADTPHYFKPNMNLHRGFNSWHWVRGQESDAWTSGPRGQFDTREHIPDYLWTPGYDRAMLQYLMNTQDWRGEEDYFCAQSCRYAMRWLERNTESKPFMLWVDLFDPHEPWDAPERFKELYYDNLPCERMLFGYGVPTGKVRSEDIPLLRALYAAEVTFADLWIGRLLEKIRDLQLMDDTIFVFSTDHGTHIGEQGCLHKNAGLLNSAVARLPLIIRHPDACFAGETVDELVSAVDLMPTFLSMLGVEHPEGVDGKNAWPLVTGDADQIHEQLFIGFGDFAAVRDMDWHYFQAIHGEQPGKGPALYNVQDDPRELHNTIDEHPEIARERRCCLEERFCD